MRARSSGEKGTRVPLWDGTGQGYTGHDDLRGNAWGDTSLLACPAERPREGMPLLGQANRRARVASAPGAAAACDNDLERVRGQFQHLEIVERV